MMIQNKNKSSMFEPKNDRRPVLDPLTLVAGGGP